MRSSSCAQTADAQLTVTTPPRSRTGRASPAMRSPTTCGQTRWTVQLEDPRKEGHRGKVPLRDAALSTSGNYENFFEINGVRYSHLLNPRTGQPVQGIAACTVIAPTCMESDAMATACFVYGAAQSLSKFGERYPMRFSLMPLDPTETSWPIRQSLDFPADD